jgi:hypothetical protein
VNRAARVCFPAVLPWGKAATGPRRHLLVSKRTARCENGGMCARGFEANWEFPSLTECLRYLGEHFPPEETVTVESRTPSGLIVLHRAPKYLYRGECGIFPTTESSLTRLKGSGRLDASEQKTLQQIHDALLVRFRQKDYGNSEWNSEGLLEHYGIPTEVINFSSALDAVGAFAASRESERGRICTLTRAIGRDAAIVEYADHPWAERAVRQKAYGVRLLRQTDLKSDEARTQLGAIWAEFPVSAEDFEGRREFYESLVDESSDPHSGMVRAEVNDYVASFGKIPENVAQYLAERIPMVPRFLKVVGIDEKAEEAITRHVSPSARPYSSDVERQRSLRYWSQAYPDSLTELNPFETPREIGNVFADPGTHHPINTAEPAS